MNIEANFHRKKPVLNFWEAQKPGVFWVSKILFCQIPQVKRQFLQKGEPEVINFRKLWTFQWSFYLGNFNFEAYF